MLNITENNLYHRLEFDNPWWAFTDETQISFRTPTRRAFSPAFQKQLKSCGQGRMMALVGPLRAGKTVMMRQAVASLIEGGASPQSIFYCNLTTPSYTAVGLTALFDMFCNHHDHGEGQDDDHELYVFYDEAQYIRGWEIEALDLAKRHPNVRFVTAVSAGAPSLVSETQCHDGRMQIFVLPPLTFPEFLRFRDTENQLFDFDKPGKSKTTGTGNVAIKHGALSQLNAEFHRYINFGGFLEGVLGQQQKGAPAPMFIRDGVADRVLHKDLAGMHGVNDAQELNKLFGLLAFNTGAEVSMDDLARTVGIAKNTVRKYLDYLESAFLIRRVARVDRDAKRFQRAVAFKVYLTSPCLYSALFGPVAPNDPVFPRLAETALVSQWLGASSVNELAYASWRGGAIDLMAMNADSDKPERIYELDWLNEYGSASHKPEGLVNFIERNNKDAHPYILTRTIARQGRMRGTEITLSPLALYCYWLGRGSS